MVLITALYASIFVMIFLLLSIHVVSKRTELGISLGDGKKDDMMQAIRAHGNFAEYVPLALVLFVMLELNGTSDILIHILGGTLLLGRVLHAWGVLSSAKPVKPRVIGTAMTWIVLGLSGSLLLLNVFHFVF